MKSNRKTATTIAGSLYLLGFVAGILSIAYAIDDPNYLSDIPIIGVEEATKYHRILKANPMPDEDDIL